MSDINYIDLPEKTTPSVSGDKVLITDSEDGNKVKIQEALQFKGPQGEQGEQGIQGVPGDNAPELEIEYSIDGVTLWHTPFTSGDFYQRVSTDGGATWSSAIKFVGEDGTGTGDMLKSENLSGLTNYATARSNLGLNTTANQTDSTDKRFMTDAQETKLDGSALDTEVVKLTGDQTIAGVKTFSSFPVSPSSAPTTDYQVANKKYVDDNAGGGSNISVTKVAGENITAPAYLRPGNASLLDIDNVINASGGGTNFLIGFQANNYEIGQGITYTGKYIKNIQVFLKKVGTGGDTVLNCLVYSDATFTTLVGTSTNQITSSALTTSYVATTFNFSDLSVPSTFYFQINIVSGTTNTSNYVMADGTDATSYAGGTGYISTSAGGDTSSGDLKFEINNGYTDTTEDVTKVYKANSTSTTYNKVIGGLTTTVTAGNNAGVILGGEITGHSSLTPGEVYYLKDDGTIGTTAGTTSVKVGRALPGGTTINFVPPL